MSACCPRYLRFLPTCLLAALALTLAGTARVQAQCTSFLPASTVTDVIQGAVDYAYYEFDPNCSVFGCTVDGLDGAGTTLVRSGMALDFNIELTEVNQLARRGDLYGFIFSGFIDVPADGEYTFETRADDGVKISIGGNVVVVDDGLHGARNRMGTICLAEGLHEFELRWFENFGGDELRLRWSGPGLPAGLTVVPTAALYVENKPVGPELRVPCPTLPGLAYDYYEFPNGAGGLNPPNSVEGMDQLTPTSSGQIANFDISSAQQANHFGFIYRGYIRIDVPGVYTFETFSSDGSTLAISCDSCTVVFNDGAHGSRTRKGIVNLDTGFYYIEVRYFERIGPEVLEVKYSGPDTGGATIPIPDEVLYTKLADAIPPMARSQDLTVVLDDQGAASITPADVDDGSTDNCLVFSRTVDIDQFSCADIGGPIAVTLTVFDTDGNMDSSVAQVSVVDRDPPNVTAPDDLEIDCSASTDPSLTGLPVVQDACTGSDDFTILQDDQTAPACDAGRVVITRTWTVIDESGNATTVEQLITLLDQTAPVITCPDPLFVNCRGDVPPVDLQAITVSDNCDADVTVVLESEGSNGGAGCSSNPLVITRVFSATDACGNRAMCTAMIAVIDREGPVLSGCPGPATYSCLADVPGPAPVTASDRCGEVPLVAFGESQSNPGSSCGNVITRTWTSTDSCGNSSSCVQVITVRDTEPPVIEDPPHEIVLHCAPLPVVPVSASGSGGGAAATSSGSGGVQCPEPLPTEVPLPPDIKATDNCDAEVEVVRLDDVMVGSCPGTIIRRWVAMDDCGLVDVAIQMVVLKKACVQSPSYWLSHPEAWWTPMGPVSGVQVDGGPPLTVDEARDILGLDRNSVMVGLAQQLIAAILNVDQGAEDVCAGLLIDRARAFLTLVPIGSEPEGVTKRSAEALEKALNAFNQGACCAPVCPAEGNSGSGA